MQLPDPKSTRSPPLISQETGPTCTTRELRRASQPITHLSPNGVCDLDHMSRVALFLPSLHLTSDPYTEFNRIYNYIVFITKGMLFFTKLHISVPWFLYLLHIWYLVFNLKSVPCFTPKFLYF